MINVCEDDERTLFTLRDFCRSMCDDFCDSYYYLNVNDL